MIGFGQLIGSHVLNIDYRRITRLVRIGLKKKLNDLKLPVTCCQMQGRMPLTILYVRIGLYVTLIR